MDDILAKYMTDDTTPSSAKLLAPLFTKSFTLSPKKSPKKNDYYFSEFFMKDSEKSQGQTELTLSQISSFKEIETDIQESPFNHFKNLLKEAIHMKSLTSDSNEDLSNKQVFLKKCSKLSSIDTKTLVLNLSETFFDRVVDPNDPYDLKVSELIDCTKTSHLIRFTSGFLDFLHRLSKDFELIVYDSGSPQVLNQILKHLDPEARLISHIVYKANCFLDKTSKQGFYKDLRVLLNRNLENVFYLSSSFDLHFTQVDNFVPVIPTRLLPTKDQGTTHLGGLIKFLRNTEPKSCKDSFGLAELAAQGEVKDESIREYFASRTKPLSSH